MLRVKDVRDVRFANEEPEREPRAVMARDAREAPAREKNETENARAFIRSSDFLKDGRPRGSTEPKWFAREDIPYGLMPADDAVWYPRLFALLDADDAKEPSRETPASTASTASTAPTDRPEGGRTERTESAWTNALAGRFAFDETGTLRRDWEVRVLATDAAM